MDKEMVAVNHDERLLSGLAHGSIVLGVFTNGVGGLVSALAIWITQREKSAYVAGQALQALVYQCLVFVLTGAAFFCWGMLWLVILIPPLVANPEAYENTPPPTLWVGLGLMIIPVGIWLLTTVYGIVAALQAYQGKPFRYALVGRWLENRI